jgi:S-formylglutathione hydrolase
LILTAKYLRNPSKYKSVSALSPICNPSNCPWGQKAFSGYFGKENSSKWAEHDATELVKKFQGPLDILIDVGDADNFYKQGQLLPEHFVEAAQASKHGAEDVKLRIQKGYDHSYYFVSSFAADHVDHAAKYLKT